MHTDHRTVRPPGRRPGTAAETGGTTGGGVSSARGFTGARGFTLIELLIVMLIAGFAMAIGVPALQNLMARSRTEGFCRQTSMMLQQARLEAIRSNRPAVVLLDAADEELIAFVDVDRNETFNPNPGAPYRTADYEVGRLTAHRTLDFEDEGGNTGQASIDGFTLVDGAPRAIFQPDGSIDDEGAFRISDVRGNHLELRVAPAATARVELRKWQDGAWREFGDPQANDYEPWEWK